MSQTSDSSQLTEQARERAIARGGLRQGAAVGLVLAGVVCLILASWILSDDLAEPDRGRRGLGVWTALVLVSLLVLLAERRAYPRTSTTRRLDWRLPAATVVAALLGLGAALWSMSGLVEEYGQGFPGHVTIVGLIGGAAVAIGQGLSWSKPRGDTWPRLPDARTSIGAAAAVIVVVAVVVPIAAGSDHWRVETGHAARIRPAPIPTSVSRVAWRTAFPGWVDDVVAAGAGVVVQLHDRFEALDGTTGKIRWTYRRQGAELVEVGATPDHSQVLIQVRPESGASELVGLDAVTGAQHFSIRTGYRGTSSPQITNASFVQYRDSDREIDARSTRTGEVIWRYHVPSDCEGYRYSGALDATPTGYAVAFRCGGGGDAQFRFVGLDGATGKSLWHDRVAMSDPRNTSLVKSVSQDGLLIGYALESSSATVPDVLFDSATGERLTPAARLLTLGRGYLTTPGKQDRIIDMRTGATLTREHDTLQCALTNETALVQSAVLCPVDGDDPADGHTTVRVATFSGRTQTLKVDLGGPYDTAQNANDNQYFRLVPAPGAVVAFTALHPVKGRSTELVGLQ